MATTVESIVDQISNMTALELSELKTALEDKFGVKLEDDSDPQAFVKPVEPKDQYNPNKHEN